MPEPESSPEQSSRQQPASLRHDGHGLETAPATAYAQRREPAQDPIGVRIAGRVIGVAIVIAAMVLAAYVTRLYYIFPRTDDAYVRANVIGIAAHVSGPIVQMPIVDNQHVSAGQLLFVVDPRPYQSAVDRAEADLALTNLQIKALEDAIRATGSRKTQLEAELAYDKQYLARIQPLLQRHFVTANDV
ncbi:MAG TPA: biotin/lipoyl-binding protein, partial [Candidatus Binataceae bacterium]|nr:biotin/lipoyl-binding protein [Candidatus Binataceae bacterium]